MSENLLEELQEMKQNIQNLYRSPTQLIILVHFIRLNKSLKISDVARDLKMSYKAAARAMDKLRSKNLISRNTLLRGHYNCNLGYVISCLIFMVCDLYKDVHQFKEKSLS